MIEIKGISKSFGTNRVLDTIDLVIEDGEFFCLLGPSGCGKTTLLRLVAGLEAPDSGTLRIGNRDVTALPPHKRECALVFQNYALWPHLTVSENISYGLEVMGKPKAEIARIVTETLSAYQLDGLGNRFPHQLSGGQQQRVALARAMAVRPRALLMDEPLSNLDATLRKSLRRDLLDFHRRAGNTILYVTHDQEEALALSDRIAVMMQGKVVECGKPAELYVRPRRLETALFLGDMNVFRNGRIDGGVARFGEFAFPCAGRPQGAGATLCIRPEHVKVVSESGSNDGFDGGPAGGAKALSDVADRNTADDPRKPARDGTLHGTLAFSEFMGTHANLAVTTSMGQVLTRVSAADAAELSAGQIVNLEFPAGECLWY